MRDALAGASFLQSPAEIDHRDRYHHLYPNHKHLHQRQPDTAIQVDAADTAVTLTISVIQQVEIDSDGCTIGVQALPASTTVVSPLDSTVLTPSLTTSIPSTISGAWTAELMGGLTSTPAVQTSQALPLTSPPYFGSNSTILSGSSSLSTSSSSSSQSTSSFPSFSSNISNLTLTSLTSSTKTITSFSTSSEFSASISSSSLSAEPYHSSDSPAPSIVGVIAVGSGPGSTSSNSSTSIPGAGAAGGTSPTTKAVVGGLFGGLAGIVFIVALLMVIIRWRKRKQSVLRLGDSPSIKPTPIGGGSGTPSQPGGMIEKSLSFAIPAALASLAGYKRQSRQPSVEVPSMSGTEPGFYRVSGRKLPSVFQYGGDGYGGGYKAQQESLSGSSFYRDSQGFCGDPGSPVLPRSGRESGIPITRPSPARTPVISEGLFSPSPQTPPPMDLPDTLGRSHPSRDGSNGSRFAEEV